MLIENGTYLNNRVVLILDHSIFIVLLVGLCKLESINLSFTVVTDGGLRELSGLTSLKSLNLDARHVTDAGLAALTSKTIQSSCQGQFSKAFHASFKFLSRHYYLCTMIYYEICSRFCQKANCQKTSQQETHVSC